MCVVAFGLRDLRLIMKPLVVVFLDYYLVLCWRWGGRAFIDIAAFAGGGPLDSTYLGEKDRGGRCACCLLPCAPAGSDVSNTRHYPTAP